MRGGFRRLVPVRHSLSDDELVERTGRFRRAFNEYYRVHGCEQSAGRYAEDVAGLPMVPGYSGDSARTEVVDAPEWGDAA